MKVLKWLFRIFLVFILLLGVAAAYIFYAPDPSYEPLPTLNIQVNATPERIAIGEKHVTLLCAQCHLDESGKMAGKKMLDLPDAFGSSFSANITRDPDYGIGKWTDGEIMQFVRTGLRKDGYFTAWMPKFPLIADEDLESIVAFLRSGHPWTEPSQKPRQYGKPTLLSKFLIKNVFKPYPYPKEPVAYPDTNDKVVFGKYLATGLYGCFACHSQSFEKLNELEPEKSAGYFGGGNPMPNMEGQIVPSANITMDKETGIGNWTEEQFVQTLRTMKNPSGKVLRYPMIGYNLLTDLEIRSIWAYLQTVPAIDNKVVSVE